MLDHGTSDGLPGLLSVLGVKYTTARAVAEVAAILASVLTYLEGVTEHYGCHAVERCGGGGGVLMVLGE